MRTIASAMRGNAHLPSNKMRPATMIIVSPVIIAMRFMPRFYRAAVTFGSRLCWWSLVMGGPRASCRAAVSSVE